MLPIYMTQRHTASSYKIPQSIRFNDDDSAYMHRTSGSVGSRRVLTFSFWVKRCNLGATMAIWGQLATGQNYIRFTSTNTLQCTFENTGGGAIISRITSGVFRDTGGWTHIHLQLDSNQTDDTSATLTVNGVQVTAFGTKTNPGSAQDLTANGTQEMRISRQGGASNYFDGYVTAAHFIDGTNEPASSFGEFDANGVWVPIAYTGSYGTNGFHIDGADSADLGNDVSGNNNDFTTSGLTSADQMLDSPADDAANGVGNYPTFSPLHGDSLGGTWPALSGGNNTIGFTTAYDGWWGCTLAFPLEGVWKFEYQLSASSTSNHAIGIKPAGKHHTSTAGDGNISNLSDRLDGYFFASNGESYNTAGTAGTYGGDTWTGPDVVTVVYDADNGDLTFYMDGVSQGVAYTGIDTAIQWMPCAIVATNTLSGTANFGATAFQYDAVEGSALSTSTLPAPAIVDSSQHHQVELVTHDGTSTAFTCNWNADTYDTLFIIKNRDTAEKWYWVDGLNGYNKYTDGGTSAQQTDTNVLSVSGTTITLGSTLLNDNYVVECHKGGLAGGASNTDGVTTTTVSANTTSGFAIGLYTGAGSATTLGSSLASAVEMATFRKLSAGATAVTYHAGAGNTGGLDMNGNSGLDVSANYFNNTSPTASVFSIGGSTAHNATGASFLFYAWHGVEGYSAFGKYEGNGSTDGTFVAANMLPASFLGKSIDGARGWNLLHAARPGYNLTEETLLLNNTNPADSSNPRCDIVSGGVKLRTTVEPNHAETHIYSVWGGTPIGGSGVSQGRAR